MGAVVAVLMGQPGLLRCEVERLRAVVSLRGGDGPPPAAGFGWFSAREVVLGRRPSGLPPGADFPELVGRVEGEALLAHADRPAGPATNENTQPFRRRRWLFAAEGTVEGWEALQPALEARLPDHLRRAVHGDTPAERLMALFFHELHGVADEDGPGLTAGEAGRGLALALRRLDELARGAGVARTSGLTLVATNGRILAAARRGRPLSYGLIEGIVPCALHGVSSASRDTDPEAQAHRRARAVCLATRVREPARFLEVPDGSVVTVERSLAVRVTPLEAATGPA
jgi:glutamine amidotransferase